MHKPASKRFHTLLRLVLMLAPILIAIGWGFYPTERADVSFLHARNPFAYEAINGGRLFYRAPLWHGMLATLALLGAPFPQVGMALSNLGWGVVANISYRLIRQVSDRRAIALFAAFMLVLSPMVISTGGTEIPWLVGLWALTVSLSIQKRWPEQMVIYFLLLVFFFDVSMLLLGGALLLLRWKEESRFPVGPSILIGLAGVTPAIGNFLLFEDAFAWSASNPAEWLGWVRRLLSESEFYWLFLPFLALGLLAVVKRGVGREHADNLNPAIHILPPAGWGIAVLFRDGLAGMAVLLCAGLLLVGVGLDWLADYLQERNLVRLEPARMVTVVTMLAATPLLAAYGSSMWHRYQIRPITYRQLEDEVGLWLREHTPPDATLLGSARLGYLTDRFTVSPSGLSGERTDFSHLTSLLVRAPPDFVVSDHSIVWDKMVRTGWFQERYRPAEQFPSAYESAAPLTIWAYHVNAFDEGEKRTANVLAGNGMRLVAYQYWPEVVDPGAGVHVTLYWETNNHVTTAFDTIVRLISPPDQVAWAQRGMSTPRSFPPNWIRPGEMFAERIVLTTTLDIPVGAYQLNLSLIDPRSESFMSFHQDNDTNALDRVSLGNVIVPWLERPGAAESLGATFGDQILLPSFELRGDRTGGGTLTVILYWEALRPPDDDFTVFVHLIDDNQQLVAGHDGKPLGGYYTTDAWRPGYLVPDEHPISLPPGLPPGEYELKVGLYQLSTGVRLPVFDASGAMQPAGAATLGSIEINE